MGVTSEDLATFIRPARFDEDRLLSELALRSKSHWGYGADFLEGCRKLLTISPEEIRALRIFVLEKCGRVVGFYGLREHGEDLELLYLFVEPSEINHGCGKLLWNHASETARILGARRILIESDPNAEDFYLAMGARRTGETISPLDPSRILPLMEFTLDLTRARPDSDG